LATAHINTQHADKAQQAFSSVQTPTLFNAIPAIETLHAAWSSRANKYKYGAFKNALDAAATKLNGYYEKTAESDAHILAMRAYTTIQVIQPVHFTHIYLYSFAPREKDESFRQALG